MTPAEKAGLVVGEKYVVMDTYTTGDKRKIGGIYEFIEDDGSYQPEFICVKDNDYQKKGALTCISFEYLKPYNPSQMPKLEAGMVIKYNHDSRESLNEAHTGMIVGDTAMTDRGGYCNYTTGTNIVKVYSAKGRGCFEDQFINLEHRLIWQKESPGEATKRVKKEEMQKQLDIMREAMAQLEQDIKSM